MLRLTKDNQRVRLAEDAERVRNGRSPDFSIGQHLELLIRRVEALERRDSDGSGEAGETRSGSTEGDSAGRDSGIAQTTTSRNPNP